MRMLHMICDKTLRDGICNETICIEKMKKLFKKVGVVMVWAHTKDG